MSENNWNKGEWEQNVYQTGSTRPPKNHRTTVALLLVAVIFLGGIVSALSLMNIRLFWQNSKDKEPVSFHFSGENTEITEASTGTEASVPMGEKKPQLQLSQSPLSVENVPQEGGLSLQSIYDKAIDSVVSVSCTTRKGTSSGTGVILSADGYVVTNCHVVEKAVSVQVLLNNGTTCDATVVGVDAASDLAVLYVQGQQLTPAEFGDSSALRVGDCVVAIGDPLGIELRGTMTDGIVSAINRDVSAGGRTMSLIQTNAALNSGNSGGPLLNCYGQVVGINTMKIGDYMSEAGVEGLGFAIPSTTVKDVVEQLMEKGHVSGRPTMGITGQEISAFEQHYYRIPQGIYITAVEENSDAAKKGVCPGDILLQADGVRVTDGDVLKEQLYAHQAGDAISVVIYRSGKQYTLEIVLGEQQ